MDDVRAALTWLENEYRLPVIFAGFSFGAAVGLRAACPDARVAALIALGLPVQVDDRQCGYEFLKTCGKPKLLVSSSQDQYAPRSALEALVPRLAEPKRLVIIEGGDHFFDGHLPEMKAAVEKWVAELVRR